MCKDYLLKKYISQQYKINNVVRSVFLAPDNWSFDMGLGRIYSNFTLKFFKWIKW